MNALVVDDEEDIGSSLKEDLELLGFKVTAVITGEEAIALLSRMPIDLAVVDMKLATNISGLDVMRTVRERYPKAIAMSMTGYVDLALKQEAEKLGVTAYLSKPDDILSSSFRKRVRQLLEERGLVP